MRPHFWTRHSLYITGLCALIFGFTITQVSYGIIQTKGEAIARKAENHGGEAELGGRNLWLTCARGIPDWGALRLQNYPV